MFNPKLNEQVQVQSAAFTVHHLGLDFQRKINQIKMNACNETAQKVV